jgi:hypothetical protein
MMRAPSAWPRWLPMEVAIEAERILNSGLADETLALRLASDERMKRVWNELSRHKPSGKPVRAELLAALSSRVDIEPPEDCDTLATFFWCAYTIAWLSPAAGTISPRNVPITRYRAEAAALRLVASRLRLLDVKYGPQVIDDDADDHIRHIEDAADFCDANAAEFEKIKAAETPLIVDRARGNEQARGYVRMLAAEARRLFGRVGYGTVATVASAALGEKITPAQVRKWCASLD